MQYWSDLLDEFSEFIIRFQPEEEISLISYLCLLLQRTSILGVYLNAIIYIMYPTPTPQFFK